MKHDRSRCAAGDFPLGEHATLIVHELERLGVPLDDLHAETAYQFGRLAASPCGMIDALFTVIEAIATRAARDA